MPLGNVDVSAYQCGNDSIKHPISRFFVNLIISKHVVLIFTVSNRGKKM